MTKNLLIGRRMRKVEILESSVIPEGFNPWADTEEYLIFAERLNDPTVGPYTINPDTLKALRVDNAVDVVKAKIITGQKTIEGLKKYMHTKNRHIELISRAIKVLEENNIQYR